MFPSQILVNDTMRLYSRLLLVFPGSLDFDQSSRMRSTRVWLTHSALTVKNNNNNRENGTETYNRS